MKKAEDMTDKEIIEELGETCEQLTEACEDLMKLVEELKEENTMLTDIIIKYKLATKVEKRRKQIKAKKMTRKIEESVKQEDKPMSFEESIKWARDMVEET